MQNLYRYLVRSESKFATICRKTYRSIQTLSIPCPKFFVKPMLWIFLTIRAIYFWLKRVFIAEPLFKAYCKQVGRRVRTGVFVHWVLGNGDIILGDDVLIDGKCTFIFSSRYSGNPTLTVGDRTGISHGCSFTVGKRITIGKSCRIAWGTAMFDSSGHPADPEARLSGLPPGPDEVRPIEIGDNVWIGFQSTIYPGVTIGEGAVVSANSVVRTRVAPYTIVAGNPAHKIADLKRPDREASESSLRPSATTK